MRRRKRKQTGCFSEPDKDRHTLNTTNKGNECLVSVILRSKPRSDKVHVEALDLSDTLLALRLNVPSHYGHIGLRMEDVLVLRGPLVRAYVHARGTTGRLCRYFIMPYNVRALAEWEARESGRGKERNKKRGTGRTHVILAVFHSLGCITHHNISKWDLIGTSRVICPSNIRSTMETVPDCFQGAYLRLRFRISISCLVPRSLCRCCPFVCLAHSSRRLSQKLCMTVCVMTRGTRCAFPLWFCALLPTSASESQTYLFDLVAGYFLSFSVFLLFSTTVLGDIMLFILFLFLFCSIKTQLSDLNKVWPDICSQSSVEY